MSGITVMQLTPILEPGKIPLLDKGSGTPIIVTSFIQLAFAEKYY